MVFKGQIDMLLMMTSIRNYLKALSFQSSLQSHPNRRWSGEHPSCAGHRGGHPTPRTLPAGRSAQSLSCPGLDLLPLTTTTTTTGHSNNCSLLSELSVSSKDHHASLAWPPSTTLTAVITTKHHHFSYANKHIIRIIIKIFHISLNKMSADVLLYS